ncbi:MAG: hypothetical protein HYW23_04475 [Candidatus Aenigmarchaeota archaeon]|nr:hypothetical protein [Candidatus Aenigmarchaeota archaeon]
MPHEEIEEALQAACKVVHGQVEGIVQLTIIYMVAEETLSDWIKKK